MSGPPSSTGTPTAVTAAWGERLEAAWRAWRAGQEPPRWEDFLPAPGEPCDPERVFFLIQTDLEFRARAGVPGLLAAPYFRHPRLPPEARPQEDRQVELIRWEYQQRWKRGARVRRAEYLAEFPQHAAFLDDLRPRWNCPACRRRNLIQEETAAALRCSHCGADSPAPAGLPPCPAPPAPAGLDLRDYHLLDALGAGGMGEVYRARDPSLGRDLAVKILRALFRGDREAEARFLREARVTGALQHPGIVPIHNLGCLPDGRLYYTMKLVQGHTLERILKERAARREHLPELVSIFEKVCQAVAYAHSRGVVHRDLKPANVMVGAFGEVQVMDWGLAKASAGGPEEEASGEGPTAALAGPSSALATAPGAILGTAAFMPPEQARGALSEVDERADVFALGGTLCVLLTGRPPHAHPDWAEALGKAQRGDLGEAQARLDGCGADPELVSLARACLAAAPAGRPRDAGVVAARVAAYQAGVQERLRRAELERAQAQVRAAEERKRRRLAVALAAAVVGLVVAGGAVAGWQWQRQAATDQAVGQALLEARLRHERARANPLDPGEYEAALAAAGKARDVARAGGASAEVGRAAEELCARLEGEAQAIARDRRLLVRLLDTRRPSYTRARTAVEVVIAAPTDDEQFAAAFRAWGLDVDATPLAEARARLAARPPAVVTEIIAALDEWAERRQRLTGARQSAQRLADLAAALDDTPDSKRRELRAILSRRWLPTERALGALAAALRPVPVPAILALGADSARLRRLADQTDPAAEPLFGLMVLARALAVAGDAARAEQILRAAVRARPRAVVLYQELASLLTDWQRPRWGEAVECYTAARALRPELGEALALALQQSGRDAEALALLDRLAVEDARNPYLHFIHGNFLKENGQPGKAAAAYRRAVALDPQFAHARVNLGLLLAEQKDLDGAIAVYRKALAVTPRFASAHNNLSNVLYLKGDFRRARQAARQAVALDPNLPQGHFNLGLAQLATGEPERAAAAFRRAIALNPKYARAYYNLGLALHARNDLKGAIAAFRRTIALEPGHGGAHNKLGISLQASGDSSGAVAAFRRALALAPQDARAHFNLGLALFQRGEMREAHTAFRAAATLAPGDGQAHGGVAQALFRLGRCTEAREAGRRALVLLPTGHRLRPVLAQLLRDCERLLRSEKE